MTLQDQYTQINEGKGAKDVFLKHAKKLFPNMIPNHYGYEDSVKILKQRSVITENIWGIANASNKQPDWFKIFNENLNEYDKASNWENENIKEIEQDSEDLIDFDDENFSDSLIDDYDDMDRSNDDAYEKAFSSMNEAKMYYHVLEDGGYGRIGHQGYYNTPEEAKKRADELSDMFPKSDFYVEAYPSKREPVTVTMESKVVNEAKTYTPSSQEVDVKSKSTKTAKEVEVKYDKKYDNTDTKKADNVIFDQLIRGVQFEMKNSKNADKTVEEIKNIVLKNLTKDPIWYTKNAMFGVKDLGYTNDIPGYRPSKSDQMIPVSKDKVKANVKDDKNENKKGMPKKVDQMTSTAKSSKGVQKMATPGKPTTIKPKN